MTNQQLYLLLGIPLLGNGVLIGLLVAYINAKIDGLDAKIGGLDAKIGGLDARIGGLRAEIAGINQRFDDMRDLWRAELRRVEEVLDARLRHLEERG